MTTRQETLASLDGRHFDAVVVGGGINGAAVTRDATLRGLSVCLFEKGDYGGGTSSKSTKIAHGGLRYLKHYEFGLVFESQQERHVLRRLLPHLVWPQSFIYPVYEGQGEPLWLVRLGVGVYDLLALFRNVERHRHLSPERAIAANPGLDPQGLRGAVRYWDDRMDDARVCLENVLSARVGGATCLNYVEVVAIAHEGTRYRVRFRSDEGVEGAVTAAAVVNCGGPWISEIAGLAGVTLMQALAPSKGVHVIVPRLPLDDALILSTGPDDRAFFVIPWGGHSLIGTTDTPFSGDPDKVEPATEDIEYLLGAAARYLPGQPLARDAVSFAFAGLRPLVAPADLATPPGAISRRHHLSVSRPAFLTLAGGKFTTYRRMAEETVDALLKALGRRARRSPTRRAPFFEPSSPKRPPGEGARDLYREMQAFYGPRVGAAFDFLTKDERLLKRVAEPSPTRLGQLAFALEHEEARRLDDLLFRRTHLIWERGMTAEAAHAAIDALAPLFGERLDQVRAEADALAERPAWAAG